MSGAPCLDDPRGMATLQALHARARQDVFVFMRALPSVAWSLLRGRPAIDGAVPFLKDASIPVDPDQGEFLYLTARVLNAKRVVEFRGSSLERLSAFRRSILQRPPGRMAET
jgi:hypothetical protein